MTIIRVCTAAVDNLGCTTGWLPNLPKAIEKLGKTPDEYLLGRWVGVFVWSDYYTQIFEAKNVDAAQFCVKVDLPRHDLILYIRVSEQTIRAFDESQEHFRRMIRHIIDEITAPLPSRITSKQAYLTKYNARDRNDDDQQLIAEIEQRMSHPDPLPALSISIRRYTQRAYTAVLHRYQDAGWTVKIVGWWMEFS